MVSVVECEIHSLLKAQFTINLTLPQTQPIPEELWNDEITLLCIYVMSMSEENPYVDTTLDEVG